jgi:hypothetical protein
MKNSLILIILFFASCAKRTENVTPNSQNIERVENLVYEVSSEPMEIEEADECEEVYDSEGSAKITLSAWKADTSTTNCVSGQSNKHKYLNHFVAQYDGELAVDIVGLPTDSITGISCDYMDFVEQEDERTKTHRTLYMRNIRMPQYKPRTLKIFVAVNGKVLSKSAKFIPSINNSRHAQFGQSEYFINIWGFQNKFLTSIDRLLNETRYPIDANFTPTLGKILCYGNHYAVISTTPVRKNTKVNGIYKDVFVFRIREQNSFCNQKTTSKKMIWYPGIGVPNTNPKRDSAYFYRELSFP